LGYKKFRKNINKQKLTHFKAVPGYDVVYTIDINMAFTWKDTPEGDDYWAADATGSTDLDTDHKVEPAEIERLMSLAETVDPMIQPIRVKGEDKFIYLMHTYCAFDLRTAYSEGDWGQIHMNVDVKKSPNTFSLSMSLCDSCLPSG